MWHGECFEPAMSASQVMRSLPEVAMKYVTSMCVGLLSAATIAGCASTDVSAEKMAAPQVRIAAAKEAGAAENPTAALHLKLSNDALEKAKVLARDGQGERANMTLDRATVDAELALELARLDNTRRDANQAMDEIQKLRRQNQ
jgi:hypothetical protein